MSRVRVAAVQMVSGVDVAWNLGRAGALVARAAAEGAKLVVLPEGFAWYGGADVGPVAAAERDAAGPVRSFLSATAREHRILLVGGTVPVADGAAGSLPRAACLLYDEDGGELARYDKMHLFDVDLPDAQRRYRESETYAPGERLVCVPGACGMLGLGVCYDLRFPEMFRALGQRGMDVLALPSAFTRLTGEAHWLVLLRARAIENQVYVVAAAQGGRHSPARETWGGSVIVDPWGRVLASAAVGEAVITAEVDRELLAEVRARLPVRAHQRIHVPG